jgi:hypothetical protein
MDPTTASVLIGLGTNWLSSFGSKVASDSRSLIAPPSADSTVQHLVAAAVDDVLRETHLPGTFEDHTIAFLVSPEVSRIASQLFVSQLSGVQPTTVQKEEFVNLASLWTAGQVDALSAEDLFALLISLTQALLGRAIEEGVLAAHEARSTFRFNVLMGELNRTQQLFAAFNPDAFDLPSILNFETELRDHVATETAQLMPPYLDDAKRVALDSLFVAPTITPSPSASYPSVTLSVAEFVAQSYRAVVLGDPGGGKSTLAQKICHDLASQPSVDSKQITPVLVRLRDYGVRKRDSELSLKDFLYELAHAHYQLDPPAHSFEYLLSQGRLLIVLDGLDELVNTADRQRISGDVEHFCTTYTGLPVIVTSRKVGYDQAPLDAAVFEPFELGEFSLEQATEYATKWFQVDTTLSPAEQSKFTTAFIRECEDLADLRSNALMLGLLCNIYRGENWIPRNRPAVYEKCALLLFERWDRRRGITAFQAFESHLRPALEYLAHWIFCDPSRQGGVSESALIDAAATYLYGRRFEDQVEATHAAREFIEFCRGRAWVFTDTGTAADGERLYQFTHRTFLEYFTAVHLVRTHPTAGELGALLRPRVLNSEWEMVSQLAVHIQDRQVDHAGDSFLGDVLDAAIGDGASAAIAGVGFVARALDGLVPRPATSRRAAAETVRLVLELGRERRGQGMPPLSPGVAGDDARLEVLEALLSCSSENWDPVDVGLREVLDSSVADTDSAVALAAAELGANLTMAARFAPPGTTSVNRWREASVRFLDSNSSRVAELAEIDSGISGDLFWAERLTLEEFFQRHNLSDIFTPRTFACFPNRERISIAQFVLLRAFPGWQFGREMTSDHLRDDVRTLGAQMAGAGLPWAKQAGVRAWLFGFPEQRDGPWESPIGDLSDDAFFALFGVTAAAIEQWESEPRAQLVRRRTEVEDWLARIPDGAGWRALKATVTLRRGIDDGFDAAELPLNDELKAVVASWARGEVSVLELPTDGEREKA